MNCLVFVMLLLAVTPATAFSPYVSAAGSSRLLHQLPTIASARSQAATAADPTVSEAAEAAFAKENRLEEAFALLDGMAPTMREVVLEVLSLDDMPAPPKRSPLSEGLLKARLRLARPWRRVKYGSVLTIPLGGPMPERSPRKRFPFDQKPPLSLSEVTLNLQKAAADPRISGVILIIQPLTCGWGKVSELVRSLKHFQSSGKFCMCYLEIMTEKEAVVAAACGESYMPPSAYISLTGVSLKGQFLGDVLRKAGVEPQIQRIGAYKSAGDQLQRGNMSTAQREVLNALADDVYEGMVCLLAELSNGTHSEADVRAMLDAGTSDATTLAEGGWITGVKYMDEVEVMLQKRTLKPLSSLAKLLKTRGAKDKEAAVARIERKRKIPSVTSQRYARVPPKAIGLGGKSTVAVLRASGAISGRTSSGRSGRSSGIVAASVIKEARKLRKMRSVKAVVLRVDSPGGDALSSDLMWRELRLLAATKPLVASMSDVAASGGYYMSMAAPKIVAEGLTLTGSIGIITGKFQFSDLYQRVGFGTELISRGKFAEASADNRPYTEEEEAYVKANAQKSYTLFRDTAAFSRNLTIHATEAVAQGRVWTGRQAKGAGLVDALGGLWTAIALAKKEAKIDGDVRVFEAGVRRSRAPDLVGAAAAAAYNALVGAVLGSDAQLLTGLSHGNAPQAFAPGLDPSLVGESTFGFASPPAEDDGGLWQ